MSIIYIIEFVHILIVVKLLIIRKIAYVFVVVEHCKSVFINILKLGDLAIIYSVCYINCMKIHTNKV